MEVASPLSISLKAACRFAFDHLGIISRLEMEFELWRALDTNVHKRSTMT